MTMASHKAVDRSPRGFAYSYIEMLNDHFLSITLMSL
jgi:hypothetical protein